jgi:chromate transporter
VFVLGRRAIVDGTTALIAIVALAGMVRLKKLPEPFWIALAGLVGVVARGLRGR